MHPLVLLAKSAVETFVKEGKIISPPSDLPGEYLIRRAGTFVTIEKAGELRGCIGTYLPTKENIALEVIHNAISAATEDPRFEKVKEEEFNSLSYTVYILQKPEKISSLEELDPKKYGIIIKTTPITSPNGTNVVFNGHQPFKTGLLLPDLEGIDTVGKQIFYACQKGGINPKRERIEIYRFTVEKYT